MRTERRHGALPAQPGGSHGWSRRRMLAELPRGQPEPHDDLTPVVELAGGHEPEPLAEAGEPIVLRQIASQQVRRALGPHQLRDLPLILRCR